MKTRVEMPDKSWQGPQHRIGSVAQYIKRGCRCDKCREVTMDYYRERRRIKGDETRIVQDDDATYIKGEQK